MVPKERLVRRISNTGIHVLKADTCKEAFYGRPVILADREMVELESDVILKNADSEDVSLLVVGDPFG